MKESGIGGLVVVDEMGRLQGMLTARDLLLAPDTVQSVSQVMTPRARLVVARQGESLESARLALHEHRIEKLPLVDSEDRVVGLITAQDITQARAAPPSDEGCQGPLASGGGGGGALDRCAASGGLRGSGGGCAGDRCGARAFRLCHRYGGCLEKAAPRRADHRRECGDGGRGARPGEGGGRGGEGGGGGWLDLHHALGGGGGGAAVDRHHGLRRGSARAGCAD